MASITERETLADTSLERLFVITKEYNNKLRNSGIEDQKLLNKMDVILLSIEVLLEISQPIEERDFDKIQSIVNEVTDNESTIFTYVKNNIS